MRRLTASLLLLALFFTACGDDDADTVDAGSGGGGGSEVTIEDLQGPGGRTYVSTSVTGHELVAGTEVTMTFVDERVSITAGCNSQNAGYEIVDGAIALTSELAGTLIGCEDDLQAQDEWLSAFISGEPAVALDGDTLTLTAGDESLELSAQA